MKILYQPYHSNQCGQYCVAMIAGVTPEESIKAFGIEGATRTKEVQTALKCFRIKSSKELCIYKGIEADMPPLAMIRIKFPDANHWAIYLRDEKEKGWIYDPFYGKYTFRYARPMKKAGGWVTSFLGVFK